MQNRFFPTNDAELLDECIETYQIKVLFHDTANGSSYGCALCHTYLKLNPTSCGGCPLDKAGDNCNMEGSTWRQHNCESMLTKLQELRDELL